jgi:peptidoglycan/LPS O-acetylase OafA/YrhL
MPGSAPVPDVTGPPVAPAERLPALDGVRCFAVLAVIAYHGGVSWMVGGYYGVDAFLVLSGFLITSLLVGEWDRRGSISLRGFWARRARRLFPALLLMLAGVAVVVGAFPGVLSTTHLFSDTVATILYVANWHLAAEHTSYFAAVNAPSPLMHTWTLAIEEQFYVVWPVIVLAVLKLRRPGRTPDRRRRLRALLALAGGGAAASAVWMMVLAPTNGADPSRAYYGSDTRAQGLLVGAALAITCGIWGRVRTRTGARVLGALGVLGAAGVGLMWATVQESSFLAFHGGFLLVTLACAAVVAAAARVPASPVGRLLALAPVRYLGRISYGMYLWYWPVQLVMTGGRTHLRGNPLLLARLGVVVAVAALSYHLVETPIRRGALAGWRARLAAPAGALAAAGAVLVATTLGPVATATASAPGMLLTHPAVSSLSGDATEPGSGAPVAGSGPGPAGAVRVLLVGDSMAGSLGVGLADQAGRYGAELVNDGMPGCSVSTVGMVKVLWYTLAPGKPCVAGNPQALLGTWKQWVDEYRPDVVVYLARSEVLDQQVDGQWENVTDPAFSTWLAGRFQQAAQVLGSDGARVVLLTTPVYETGEQSNGDPWAEDDPARVAADNAVIRSLDGSDGVTVLDAGELISPGGRFAAMVGGVPMRCSDGVHLTRSGGQWLASRLLPQLVDLGAAHARSASGSRPPLPPAQAPWWWGNLPCNV